MALIKAHTMQYETPATPSTTDTWIFETATYASAIIISTTIKSKHKLAILCITLYKM